MAKKTRLSHGLRDTIYSNIVSQLPKVDYDSQIQDYLNKAARTQLPLDLQRDEFQDYIGQTRIKFCGVYVANPKYEPTQAQIDYVNHLRSLDRDQIDNENRVCRSLRALLNSFTYVEDLAEQAPEFAKYIPTEQAPLTNLPAVQLTEQLHALGWPKSDAGK